MTEKDYIDLVRRLTVVEQKLEDHLIDAVNGERPDECPVCTHKFIVEQGDKVYSVGGYTGLGKKYTGYEKDGCGDKPKDKPVCIHGVSYADCPVCEDKPVEKCIGGCVSGGFGACPKCGKPYSDIINETNGGKDKPSEGLSLKEVIFDAVKDEETYDVPRIVGAVEKWVEGRLPPKKREDNHNGMAEDYYWTGYNEAIKSVRKALLGDE